MAAESLLRHFRIALQSSENFQKCLRGTRCMPRPKVIRSTDFIQSGKKHSVGTDCIIQHMACDINFNWYIKVPM